MRDITMTLLPLDGQINPCTYRSFYRSSSHRFQTPSAMIGNSPSTPPCRGRYIINCAKSIYFPRLLLSLHSTSKKLARFGFLAWVDKFTLHVGPELFDNLLLAFPIRRTPDSQVLSPVNLCFPLSRSAFSNDTTSFR